jgi:hypothetical protein
MLMKKFVHAIFRLNEKIIARILRWNHIPYSENNFMYFAPYIYRGKPVALSDGTTISRGDRVAELHIDNIRVGTLDTRYPNLLKLLQGEISALKRALKESPYSDIKAVYGITVFYDIARRQGFTVKQIGNPVKRALATVWENILRIVFKKGNKSGRRRINKSKECWLSRSQIMNMES